MARLATTEKELRRLLREQNKQISLQNEQISSLIYSLKSRLLKGVNTPIDPEFLNNLSEILADFNDKLNELDNGKQDKPYDW
jgi:hypothetical protein